MQVINTPSNNATGNITSFVMMAGENVSAQLTFASGGSPVNLTGFNFKMNIGFPSPLLLSTGAGSIVITNAASGILTFNLNTGQTENIPGGSYPYDLWLINSSNAPTPLLSGYFIIQQSITAVP